ncbi:H /oligopeptide symporter [Phaffia rhodozyma]|uniref:H /oligopeptide symporter n=1 Tax=Phaffia rhodozyma TaxID=264483 RepID=A0A0F7SLF3_PHARH|nr:H /oligopeptide symporter [Phaffia rhodozyma]
MSAGQNTVVDYESAPVAQNGLPSYSASKSEKDVVAHPVSVVAALEAEETERIPTEEELRTLPKVPAALPWAAFAICMVEFAERASYYGCTGVFGNFVRGALPIGGNGAGAVDPSRTDETAGALGKGSVTATALTQTFTFLAYTVPILGAIIADTKWGRFKTIAVGTVIGVVSHFLLIIPAAPSVIASGNAMAPFIISILILAFASGFIKPCLGPLLCDQSPVTKQVVITQKDGSLAILDPQTTIQRYLLIFYWAINIGSFFSLATSYSAYYVGFWLAFLIPGILYLMVPVVLVIVYKRLYHAPPQGSVLVEASRVVKVLWSRGFLARLRGNSDTFWNFAKPSEIEQREGTIDRSRVLWDDKFVDELRQTVAACKVFLLIPIFNLADGGFGNSENDMSASMVNNGVPNDLISNFNALTIVIFTPILNWGIYPYLAKRNIVLQPMTRMSIGFMLGSINMIIGAILQWRVYATSPCGNLASTCDELSTVNLWAQIPLYSLPAIGELFVNVTSYELAYTRAPARMKGLVFACALFTSAISSALALACSKVVDDPYLVWPYVALAVACFLCAIALPTYFKELNTFADPSSIDRMEGRQQHAAMIANQDESIEHDRKY